ncbi:WXG100 family type VII secretion target [Melissospora conviva]|uniref:WXG100 family type VII secretion target n=1 Tax=Melissospora conviva TaxID=3388432 RepID=UPI003C194303
MSFTVQPAHLDGYARQVGRAGNDCLVVNAYLGGYPAPSGWGDGALIGLAGPWHAKATTSATTALERCSETLFASKAGLASAASYYRWTDSSAAARMDRSLERPRSTDGVTPLERSWAENDCAPSFSDRVGPADRLTDVKDVEFSHPLGFMDYLSISHWALTAFDAVFGFNPLERITSELAGDWQAVAQSGVAMGRAAEALHDVGYNVQGGAIALRGGWQGAAADGAYLHFRDIATAVADLREPFKEISDKLAEIAHGVWSACESLNGLVKALLDAAIIAGLAAAAGTATAASGIGAIVGYGVAGLEIKNMLDIWSRITSTISTLYSVVQLALGVIETQIARIDDVAMSRSSGNLAYHHPFVSQHPQVTPENPNNAGGR